MSDSLSRLLGPANIPSGTTTNLLTVTSTHTYTIKHIQIENNTAGAITVKLGIGGVTDALLILRSISIGAGESLEFDGLLVMMTGETLQSNASATGLTITASGLDQV